MINFERAERPLDRGLIVPNVADFYFESSGVLPLPVFFIIMSWVRSNDVELSIVYFGIFSYGVTMGLLKVLSFGSVYNLIVSPVASDYL